MEYFYLTHRGMAVKDESLVSKGKWAVVNKMEQSDRMLFSQEGMVVGYCCKMFDHTVKPQDCVIYWKKILLLIGVVSLQKDTLKFQSDV